MEISVQDLLDKINKEGTEAALKEKDRIITEAKKEADQIVSEAKASAEKIVSDANQKAEDTVKQGEVSLSQAARNVVLNLREEMLALLSKVLNENVKRTIKADDYIAIIKEALNLTSGENPTVELSSMLFKSTAEKLTTEIKNDVKENTTLKSGFRLTLKDGKAYYDFTDKEILDLLSKYLSDGMNKVLLSK